MTSTLDRRTALVTGSTSGIGRQTAETPAARGAAGVVSGRDATRCAAVVDGIRSSVGRAEFVAADLHDAAYARGLVDAARDTLGTIDVLLNNGVMTYGATAAIADEDFDRQYAINVKAPFFLVGALAPAMAERGGVSIVNISSGVVARAGEGAARYGSTKAALEMLTKNWALEYGPAGVRVNAVATGPTDTEGSRLTAGDALPGILAAFAETLPCASRARRRTRRRRWRGWRPTTRRSSRARPPRRRRLRGGLSTAEVAIPRQLRRRRPEFLTAG